MQEDILKQIQEKLCEIEEKEHVKILHCVESGSRAWGFASPDSDYDVRFIYARDTEHYLKLEKTRDTIEWQLDEVLDINGWDIQKAFRLLHTSNPTLFEWDSSPIVYRTTEEWLAVKRIISDYFLSKSGVYHYLHTARGNYREFLRGESVKLKKYFYVLRPILACKWIMDHKTPPPMLFSELLNAKADIAIRPLIEQLLKQKAKTIEMGEGPRIDALNDYIETNLVSVAEAVEKMPPEKKADWGELDRLFFEIVNHK
jgi:predicted nucleotidyltransferase